jgi:osmoprotectant transport system permease protein
MIAILLAYLLTPVFADEPRPVVIGSKKFTESVTLGEIARQMLAHEGIKTSHRRELGGTRLLWSALRSGDIDIYPEYTGTIATEILQSDGMNFEGLKAGLAKYEIGVLPPLGFNNTYAVGMLRTEAERLRIRKISDLARHPDLKIGWGEEFTSRKDGWAGLQLKYHLPQTSTRSMDHDIAYQALAAGSIQVTDLYSTDAEIAYYDILVLEDDLNFFPRYEAVYLYRLNRAREIPRMVDALGRLSGKLPNKAMIDLNRRAKIDKVPPDDLAAEFLNNQYGWSLEHRNATTFERILNRTKEHLKLVFVSLIIAIMVAIPLGVLSERSPSIGRWILGVVSIIQTIPALALLVVLIRPLNMLGLSGIGDTPALIALFLYSLLPIVRSTHTGLTQIPLALRETAAVFNFKFFTRLLRIELPLALPSILSGIKIAAVMCVGFATLGALVGAGGYGQPILTGIRLDDYGLILEGAVPAALVALGAQKIFDFVDRRLVSPGLR